MSGEDDSSVDEGEFWDGVRYRPRQTRSKERRTLKEVLQETRNATPEPVDGKLVPELKEIWTAENCVACHLDPNGPPHQHSHAGGSGKGKGRAES